VGVRKSQQVGGAVKGVGKIDTSCAGRVGVVAILGDEASADGKPCAAGKHCASCVECGENRRPLGCCMIGAGRNIWLRWKMQIGFLIEVNDLRVGEHELM
jgi:hypothetical protein